MKSSEIFRKTPKGQSEVDAKSDTLSMKDRRVLILINGEHDAARLKQLSLCDNIVEILDNLVTLDFIEFSGYSGGVEKTENSEAITSDSKDFMCNTLLTFANRVRVSSLIDDINAADDIEALRSLVKPWYIALSETPGGMYQADDLRKEVLLKIENEDIEDTQRDF